MLLLHRRVPDQAVIEARGRGDALAAIVRLQFESIHRCEDGNGWTARALVHAVLERGGAARSEAVQADDVLQVLDDEL